VAWQALNLTDPDDDGHQWEGDPAVLVDAFAELLELPRRPEWHREAACRGKSPDLFFPIRGESTAVAKSTCRTCPVLADCASTSLQERHGIWAATSERERRKLRREGMAA
jgi:hypothetical protein